MAIIYKRRCSCCEAYWLHLKRRSLINLTRENKQKRQKTVRRHAIPTRDESLTAWCRCLQLGARHGMRCAACDACSCSSPAAQRRFARGDAGNDTRYFNLFLPRPRQNDEAISKTFELFLCGGIGLPLLPPPLLLLPLLPLILLPPLLLLLLLPLVPLPPLLLPLLFPLLFTLLLFFSSSPFSSSASSSSASSSSSSSSSSMSLHPRSLTSASLMTSILSDWFWAFLVHL